MSCGRDVFTLRWPGNVTGFATLATRGRPFRVARNRAVRGRRSRWRLAFHRDPGHVPDVGHQPARPSPSPLCVHALHLRLARDRIPRQGRGDPGLCRALERARGEWLASGRRRFRVWFQISAMSVGAVLPAGLPGWGHRRSRTVRIGFVSGHSSARRRRSLHRYRGQDYGCRFPWCM